jgi:hypothetical protein
MERYWVNKLIRMSEEFLDKNSLVDAVLYYNSREDKVWSAPAGEIDDKIGFEDLMLGRYDWQEGRAAFMKKITDRLPKLQQNPEHLEAQGITLSILRDSAPERYELLIDSKVVKTPFDKKVKNTFGDTDDFFAWIKSSISAGLNSYRVQSKEFELMSKIVTFIYPTNFLKLFGAQQCLELLEDCVKSSLRVSERYIIQSRIMHIAISDPSFIKELDEDQVEEFVKLLLDNREILSVWLPAGSVDNYIDSLTIRGYSKLMKGNNE